MLTDAKRQLLTAKKPRRKSDSLDHIAILQKRSAVTSKLLAEVDGKAMLKGMRG